MNRRNGTKSGPWSGILFLAVRDHLRTLSFLMLVVALTGLNVLR